MELRLVLSVADRATDDLPALVADHHHLMDVFATGAAPLAVAALDGPPGHGEGLARTAASEL